LKLLPKLCLKCRASHWALASLDEVTIGRYKDTKSQDSGFEGNKKISTLEVGLQERIFPTLDKSKIKLHIQSSASEEIDEDFKLSDPAILGIALALSAATWLLWNHQYQSM
jgi:hypothetical protein